jgi:hypothetical protein
MIIIKEYKKYYFKVYAMKKNKELLYKKLL